MITVSIGGFILLYLAIMTTSIICVAFVTEFNKKRRGDEESQRINFEFKLKMAKLEAEKEAEERIRRRLKEQYGIDLNPYNKGEGKDSE